MSRHRVTLKKRYGLLLTQQSKLHLLDPVDSKLIQAIEEKEKEN